MLVAVYSLFQTRVGDNIAVGRTVGTLVSKGVRVTGGDNVGDKAGEAKKVVTGDEVDCTVAVEGIDTWEIEYDSQLSTAISARSKPPLSLIDILNSPEHPDF